MFSFIAFLIYACRRSRHCAYCGQLGIKSDMRRAHTNAWVCNAFCEQGHTEIWVRP